MLNKKALAATAAAAEPVYVEDVFSTYLYTANQSTLNIVNGIDLAGEGGMVWGKNRSRAYFHELCDTDRGAGNRLSSNSTNGQNSSGDLTAFNSNGFTLGLVSGQINSSTGDNCVSWTFRKAEKFFDVVTYTGNGSNRTISHNLGSVPGCIIVKRTDTTGDWQVYHRSLANTEYLVLNTDAAKATGATRWNSTTPTSTVFSLGTDATVNANNGTYVAYLFAHDAGGFGDSGNESVIKCGSVTTSGGNATITLDWEPQFILWKTSNDTGNWVLFDVMRGMSLSGAQQLYADGAFAEGASQGPVPTATGFTVSSSWLGTGNNFTHIYIAIRRGPMKTPESGTSVFDADTQTGGGFVTTNFPVDLTINTRQGSVASKVFGDRLRGGSVTLDSTSTAAESNFGSPPVFGFASNTGVEDDYWGAAAPSVYWNLRRAPGFFDVVCYTGTGSNTTFSHNLGVVPELMIVKRRPATDAWVVYCSGLSNTEYLRLASTAAKATDTTIWNSTTPTSTVFSVGTSDTVNASGTTGTYIAYLFATVAGVSKVGSYTGNGSSQTINCGFTAGARFILIKRTDSAGDWKVIDTARGIVSGNDPTLALNSTAAEVTGTDCIDPDNSGFIVVQETTNNLNVNNATYIFLAVA